jgi:hypothetical protein
VKDFTISTTTVHDLSVSYMEQGTAFVNGTGLVSRQGVVPVGDRRHTHTHTHTHAHAVHEQPWPSGHRRAAERLPGAALCPAALQDINFDHHRAAPYANLFSNINAGLGGRLFESTGNSNNGPNTGGFATFWNIRCVCVCAVFGGGRIMMMCASGEHLFETASPPAAVAATVCARPVHPEHTHTHRARQPVALPDASFGPGMNIIGLPTATKTLSGAAASAGWVLEPLPRPLSPPDLYAAMARARKGRA